MRITLFISYLCPNNIWDCMWEQEGWFGRTPTTDIFAFYQMSPVSLGICIAITFSIPVCFCHLPSATAWFPSVAQTSDRESEKIQHNGRHVYTHRHYSLLGHFLFDTIFKMILHLPPPPPNNDQQSEATALLWMFLGNLLGGSDACLDNTSAHLCFQTLPPQTSQLFVLTTNRTNLRSPPSQRCNDTRSTFQTSPQTEHECISV